MSVSWYVHVQYGNGAPKAGKHRGGTRARGRRPVGPGAYGPSIAHGEIHARGPAAAGVLRGSTFIEVRAQAARLKATPSACSCAAYVGPITSPDYRPILCRIYDLLLLGCRGALPLPRGAGATPAQHPHTGISA